jgi:hypothetical protein
MLLFLVSRAHAHLLAGHLDAPGTSVTSVDALDADHPIFELDAEMRADAIAIELMARASISVEIPNGIFTLAPFVYLAGANAVACTAAKLDHSKGSSGALSQGDLPQFPSERAKQLALAPDSHRNSVITKNARWIADLFDALQSSTQKFFTNARNLRLAFGNSSGRFACNWLTPLAQSDVDDEILPFHRLDNLERVEAISKLLTPIEHIRPYCLPWRYDVVVCYRASLYLENARQLVANLRQAGIAAVHDELFVPPGGNWEPHVQSAIAHARLTVMFLNLADLGSEMLEDIRKFPVVKELGWVGHSEARMYFVGTSHLDVRGEAGAMFRSYIDILRSVATDSFVHSASSVLMLNSPDGRLPQMLDRVVFDDVKAELATAR